MSTDLNIYRFYKGEKVNPYDREKDNAANMFWDFEKIFEERYSLGDFSIDKWIISKQFIDEWVSVLSMKPVDKKELFKLWLYNLLMDYLPGKYESNESYFKDLYWATTSKSM